MSLAKGAVPFSAVTGLCGEHCLSIAVAAAKQGNGLPMVTHVIS